MQHGVTAANLSGGYTTYRALVAGVVLPPAVDAPDAPATSAA